MKTRLEGECKRYGRFCEECNLPYGLGRGQSAVRIHVEDGRDGIIDEHGHDLVQKLIGDGD